MIILKCVPHLQHAYVYSFDQSNSSFVALSLLLPPSMLKPHVLSTWTREMWNVFFSRCSISEKHQNNWKKDMKTTNNEIIVIRRNWITARRRFLFLDQWVQNVRLWVTTGPTKGGGGSRFPPMLPRFDSERDAICELRQDRRWGCCFPTLWKKNFFFQFAAYSRFPGFFILLSQLIEPLVLSWIFLRFLKKIEAVCHWKAN